jgi:hypothetical protein
MLFVAPVQVAPVQEIRAPEIKSEKHLPENNGKKNLPPVPRRSDYARLQPPKKEQALVQKTDTGRRGKAEDYLYRPEHPYHPQKDRTSPLAELSRLPRKDRTNRRTRAKVENYLRQKSLTRS